MNYHSFPTRRSSDLLQVTKKDFSADHYLMIYVNFNQTEDVWLPVVDEDLLEKALSYAASIADFSISKGVSTGFGCNSYIGKKSMNTIRIEPENSQQQLMYILETMAKLNLDANKSVSVFLEEDIENEVSGKDILIITSTVSNKMNRSEERRVG